MTNATNHKSQTTPVERHPVILKITPSGGSRLTSASGAVRIWVIANLSRHTTTGDLVAVRKAQ
jgi:hypothetical protein